MKQFLTTLLLLALSMLNASAEITQDSQSGLYTLKNGHLSLTVDAAKGGKVLSFKYDDSEVLSQLKWPEAFGSTFWTSPQKEWNWPPVPEYDKKNYTVEAESPVLKLSSEVSEKLKFRVRKSFAADESDHAFIITYTIVNESSEVRKVAPWEISRVQNQGGYVFFDAPVDGIWPAGLMDFKENLGLAWYQLDETNGNRKVNADGKGWLAYCSNGLLLVKCFEDLDASQPAPGEAEIQVYVNRGKAHVELESQGAYTTLQPGESLSWTVRWYLVPCDGIPVPSEALVQRVRDIIKGK